MKSILFIVALLSGIKGFAEATTKIDLKYGFATAKVEGAEARSIYGALSVKETEKAGKKIKEYSTDYFLILCSQKRDDYKCEVSLELEAKPKQGEINVSKSAVFFHLTDDEALKVHNEAFGSKSFSFESGFDRLYLESYKGSINAFNLYIHQY